MSFKKTRFPAVRVVDSKGHHNFTNPLLSLSFNAVSLLVRFTRFVMQ